ncbi:mucin-like protein [Tubulanus polymorphus]|uniref:mucin-like protein n=1 Tax=Tubulanus polymorphus TaxID=672921 RepID=UPI003DA1F168
MLVQTGFYGNLMGTSDLTPLKSFSNKAIKSLASTDIGGVSGISGNMYMSLKMSTTASADGVVCSKYLLDNKLSSTDMNDIKTCPCTESEIVMLVFIDNTKYKKNTSKSGYGQCYEVNNFKGWKQMFCCYYRNTILSDPFLLAGKAVSTHNKDVGLPAVFGHCCGQGVVDKKLSSQNLCESFVKQRPPGSCELAAAYDRGFAFGFTHFLTFDGARFNFKEVGDQQLVELRGVFVIQIRVVPNPITGKNGALIKGVAVLDVASNTGVQIILKPDGTFGEDYLDKFLIVKQVPAPFKIFSNQIIQLTVQSKKIWIYVTVKDKVMDVQVLFKRGDFTNLVVVVAKCKSVFYYTGTGTYESFLNPNYVPYTLPSNQKTLCSCDKQPVVSWSECYYDFNVKEKVIMFDAAYTHMKNAIGLISPVPKLFGPDVLNISLVSGQTFKSALPYYSSIAKSNITLKTIPTDGAFALDSNDYLTATPNNGNCYKGEFGDGLFLPIKICDCSSKYKGDLCEIPRNPCQSGPCFPGVICTPLKNGSFSCGECPGGLEGNGIDCYDPNECMKNRTICPQKCINLVRGYECGCNVGFLRAPDHRNCIDVDECANPGKCSTPNTVCVNTIGSYECTCKPGYTKDINNPANCIDVDECLTGQAKCSNMTVCVNKPGTYECMCMNYFETEENTGKCIASKLCDYYGNECQQLCQNVGIGKFRCACYNGFTLNADQKTCSVTQNPSTYKSCNPAELAANCQGGGNVAYCRVLTNNVSVIVCQCKYGYVFDSTKKSCIEIPKCQLTPNLCPSLISTGCQSLPGGQYQCTCKPGFIINANKTFCNDIDECTTAPVTNCLAKRGINTVCINTIGSYVCACKDGFKPDPTNLAGKCIPDHGKFRIHLPKVFMCAITSSLY